MKFRGGEGGVEHNRLCINKGGRERENVKNSLIFF
jgi:hypothetical protein